MTDEEIISALAEAMREARVGYYTTTAEILLPTVRRIAEQWAAEAVRPFLDLADELLVPVDFEVTHYRDGLRDSGRRIRAAALTATPNHGRNAT